MEFLSRPNVPNALANSLVQLAAAEQDPLARALGQVGKLADNYTSYQMNMKLMEKKAEIEDRQAEKKAEIEDRQAEKKFGREKETKKMEMDASIFEKLLSNDRIIGGLMGDKGMSRADAAGLLAGVQSPSSKTRQMVEGDFGKSPPEVSEGQPLSEFGVNIPGDPSVIPSKEKVKVDADMAKQFGLPKVAIGKTITMDQVIALRRTEGGGKGGGRGTPQYAQYLRVAATALPPDASAEELASYADSLWEAAQQSQSKPGSVAKPPPKPGSVPKPPPKPEVPKKKGMSIFGFKFGAGAPPKMSREERLKRLQKKGFE